MHWKAELCFQLALGADISQRVVWKWLLAAILHTLPPYEVFWGDLWFRSVSRGVSTVPRAEAVTVLKQVQPVQCLHVLARKHVRNPRNTGVWNCILISWVCLQNYSNCNTFMSRMRLDKSKKPVGYGGKRCCDLCPLFTQQLKAQDTWDLAMWRAEWETGQEQPQHLVDTQPPPVGRDSWAM